MKTVHKSVLIWYSAEEMFALVTDVAKYCEFLPWCDRANVIALEPDGMKAEIGIAFSGIHQTFTTRNTHVPGREVRMKLVDGPFSNLDGCWKFQPLGEGDLRNARHPSPRLRGDLLRGCGVGALRHRQPDARCGHGGAGHHSLRPVMGPGGVAAQPVI